MKFTLCIAFALAAVAQLAANETNFKSTTTTKPDWKGETQTVTKDTSGRVVSTSSTSTKPDWKGETQTVTKDTSGRVVGKSATTTKPDWKGETQTITKGNLGQPEPRKK